MSLPIVAIIGRPNVGKSTLFNRIIHKPAAITDDQPGITRDRNTREFTWNARTFMLVDTGGFVSGSADMLTKAVTEQSQMAIDEAAVVVFVVDVATGTTDLDVDVKNVLVRTGKPVLLAVNKIDNTKLDNEMYEFYNLGLGEPWPVSARTGRGTGDLLDEIVNRLPTDTDAVVDADVVKVALIGRQNVGKSSIMNQLARAPRSLVSDIPGTTRDAIDTRITISGRDILLIDTAGLKRVTKLKESVDYYSSLRTIASLNRCDVAVVVLDVEEGITAYDKRLISDVVDAGKGLVIAANKWDLVIKDTMTMKSVEAGIRDEIPDKAPYTMVFTSALTGRRVWNIATETIRAFDNRRFRVTTGEFNRFMEDMILPTACGDVNIYFASQVSVDPPTFMFSVNDPRKVKTNLVRFMEHAIRKAYPFEGTPLKLTFKKR